MSPHGVSRRLSGPGQQRWAAGADVGPPASVRPSLRARGAGANGFSSWFCRGRGGPGRLRLEQLVSSFLPGRSRRRLRLRLPPRTRKCRPARAVPESGTVPPPGLPARHSPGYKRLRTIPRERSPGWKPSKPGSACVVIFFFLSSFCLRHLKRGEKKKKKRGKTD